MAGGGIDYDIDHLVARVADPAETRIALAEIGFMPRGEALHVADKRIRLEELPGWSDRPLLDRIAIRVESIDAIAAQARRRGLEIDDSAPDDALRIVLRGLEWIRLDFIAQSSAQ